MKVGDLVKYMREHKDLQYLTGIVVETSAGIRFRHGQVLVMWSKASPVTAKRWEWIEQLRVINESR